MVVSGDQGRRTRWQHASLLATRLPTAIALSNLGHALLEAGRADEAIPILRARLQIPNQTGVVRRELEAALEQAG
jgi:hypothetical protein